MGICDRKWQVLVVALKRRWHHSICCDIIIIITEWHHLPYIVFIMCIFSQYKVTNGLELFKSFFLHFREVDELLEQ